MAAEYESARDAWRARLQAANVLMRYDYAWKEVEFARAASRLTGVACRLLYQFALWRFARFRRDDALAHAADAIAVAVEANGFDAFHEQITAAALSMGCRVLATSDNVLSADVVFVYVAPPGEARVEPTAQFAAFQRIADSAHVAVDELPVLCCLLGEADFLAPPSDDETERLRGLSDFALSQQLQPHVAAAKYASVAQFAVEYTPGLTPAAGDQDAKQQTLEMLMADFHCDDRNLMHFTEKWDVYAPATSALASREEEDDDDALYWLAYAKDRTCQCCHKAAAKLAACARCHNVRYCSRECQRADWRLHKRLCGKTPEEITSA